METCQLNNKKSQLARILLAGIAWLKRHSYIGEVISDGIAREQFAEGTLGSRAAHAESTPNTDMYQLRNGTGTETERC